MKRSQTALTWIIGLAAALIAAWVLFPRTNRPQPMANLEGECQSHLQQLSAAFSMYREDNDGRLPPVRRWRETTQTYASSLKIYDCPALPMQANGYAMNAALAGRSTKDVLEAQLTPLIFDSRLFGRSASDRLESFAARHRGSSNELVGNVLFLDGRVRALAAPPDASAGLKPSASLKPTARHP